MTHIFLDTGELDDTFVNRTLRDEAIHSDLTSLTKTMCTIHGLRVIRRVPVVIVENDSVGRGEVYTKTSGTCTEKKHENIGPEAL